MPYTAEGASRHSGIQGPPRTQSGLEDRPQNTRDLRPVESEIRLK